MASADELTRLHISPLSPELFKLLLPPAKLPSYANLSYHSLQNFPELSFAFLDVPSSTADQLRKQLNGVTIRGQKINISKARPETWIARDTEPDQDVPLSRPARSKERGVLRAVELPHGRKVQRGWTKSAKEKSSGKRRVARSIYTTESECLFKMAPKTGLSGSRKPRSNVVHEFEKTTKFPTFLKAAPTSGRTVHEYKPGIGWIDENQEVLDGAVPRAIREPAKNTGRWNGAKRLKSDGQRSTKDVPEDSMDVNSSIDSSETSDDSSDDSSDSSEADSSSASSSSEESEADADEHSSSDASQKEEPEVHPLEAVFKQQLQQPEADAPFSFFGQEPESDAEPETGDMFEEFEEAPREEPVPKKLAVDRNVPVIPFDPNPEALMNSVIRSLDLKLPENEKPFTEQFYESRGETNRAWKKRRREVRKDQRKRENKRREKRML